MAKPWLLLALLALVHAKDDGFDYSEGEDDPERHLRLADVVQAESKLYNEPWSSTDQSIIRMNHGINTNQPPDLASVLSLPSQSEETPAKAVTKLYSSLPVLPRR